MANSFQFEPIREISEDTKIDLEIANQKFVEFLSENFSRFKEYFLTEEKLGNYIEIDIPLLGTNFSYKINQFYGRFMISVLDHKDSKIFGHLLLDGYDFLDSETIRKLGNFQTHKDQFKRLKL